MQTKLKRIIIFCADVRRLAEFYHDCFNLAIVGDINSNWVVLDAGETQIALHKIGDEFLKTTVEKFRITGSNVKICLEIDTDLVNLRQSLLAKKVDVDEIKQFPNDSFTLCDGRDPEGNVFQLLQSLS